MSKEMTNKDDLFNEIYLQIAEQLLQSLKVTFSELDISIETLYKSLAPAPNIKMGHVAFACFPLAKATRSAPPKIAAAIKESWQPIAIVESVLDQGPYLNFKLNLKEVGLQLISSINNGAYFEKKLDNTNQKWMIEYSQPNTHKILHVGHMRNLCLGNALVRMSRYAGVDLTAVTYPGDVGTHVAKCLWYFKHHNKENIPENNKGEWLGLIYTKANNLLEEQRGTEHEEKNREQLTAILKELHAGKGEYYDLWQETKEWSIELMKEAYAWADVDFDRWFWESEMDAPSVAYAQELLEKGSLIKDQGAVGMDLTDEKLGFCMLIKSDGTGLYATKDVELARRKFEEFGVDKNIYVVDNRQSHHFKQVFKVLEKVGFEKANDCHHLQYAMVELPDGAMSSRKGNIVPLMELVQQMEAKIKADYLQKYLDDSESGWTKEQVDSTASMIANGAIKYGMIRVDNNRKIVFNMEDWLKLEGETGPYLQYVHARITSLCDKLGFETSKEVSWDTLKKPQEEALLIHLNSFNDTVASSVSKMQTMHLCSYLYDLAKTFNSFYAECSIAKAESEELATARLALAAATGKVMAKGLSLLGIPAPRKM